MLKKNETYIVFPFFEGITFPFETIYRNFKGFCYLTGVFSLSAALLVMLFGRSFACTLGISGNGIYCLTNVWGFLLLFLLLLFMMACFINRWWLIAYNDMTFAEAVKTKISLRDVQISYFLLIYLLMFLIIGGGLYVLYTRVATPDLELELAIFVGVSFFILVALTVLLNAVMFACFLDGKEWRVVLKSQLSLFDNIYKLMVWFLFYLLLFAYLIRQSVSLFFSFQKVLPLWGSGLLGDFVLYFVFYFMAVCVVSLLKLQENCIFENKTN